MGNPREESQMNQCSIPGCYQEGYLAVSMSTTDGDPLNELEKALCTVHGHALLHGLEQVVDTIIAAHQFKMAVNSIRN